MPVRKKLLFFVPAAVGVLLFALLVLGRAEPERRERAEVPYVVRVLKARTSRFVPRATGYGRVRPEKVWRAVAEVNGRVASVHERLQDGEILPAGAELLRIDETDLRIQEARLEAEVASIAASLEKLTASAENTRASLAVERRSLGLAEAELGRLRKLQESRTVPASQVDNQERILLAQTMRVVGLENAQRLIEPERKLLEAKRTAAAKSLEQVGIDLARTVVMTPFACRIGEVFVEQAQYVSRGQVMVAVDGIDVAEVVAQIPVAHMRRVLPRGKGTELFVPGEAGVRWDDLGLDAVVRLHIGEDSVAWPARFVRTRAGVDPNTRTVGVVLAVDEPYRRARPGMRPPLVKGMFLGVEIRGRPIEGRIVLPRTAVHDGRVHVLDEHNRLAVRDVTILHEQFDEVCIGTGLSAGEQVVLTDVVPPVPGRLLGVDGDTVPK